MKTRITLLLSVTILLGSFQLCLAQNAKTKISMDGMPAFVQELRQGPPSAELMTRDPVLYQRLLKRRAVLTGLLQKAVASKQLPAEALEVLKPNTLPPVAATKNSNASLTSAGNFSLVKDINTAKNSSPYNYNFNYTPMFAVLNNVIYYAADDGIHGTELWRSNGTDAGTYLVKDIDAGTASGSPNYITVYKNKLYFMAYDEPTGYEFYQSDGTAAGTVLLKDINTGTGGSSPEDFTIANNTLYFYANSNGIWQLWKTDGTAAGTVIVSDLYTTNGVFYIAQLTGANNILFFTAYNYASGWELWRSDGTVAGTYMLKDINPYNNNNYDFSNAPSNLTAYNNKLYFAATDSYGRELWQSDGSIGGTIIVPYSNGISLPAYSSYLQYQDQPFAIAKNALFFAGYSAATGTELYKYNPSNTAGIVLVKDMATADVSSGITTEFLRSMNDSIYFIMPDFTGSTYNLWKSGGTAASTAIVKTFPGYASGYTMTAAGNMLHFVAGSPTNGYELWISNGSANGTKMLKDINTGTASSNPSMFTLCNSKVLFTATTASAGYELWITDGTTANTKLVKNINTTSTANGLMNYSYQTRFAIVLDSNKIVFNGYTPATGNELWSSDGTASGTALLKDLVHGESGSSPQFYASKNGKAYFIIYDSIGQSICVTNGTTGGTKKIAVTAGNIYDLKVTDNGIVFYTQYTSSTELWRTDSNGINFRVATNIGSSSIGVAGSTCYFTGMNSYGYELWKSNGTFAGTSIIADINPGSGSSSPSYFTTLGSKILFTAYNGTDTYLWVSDGTTAGTKLLSNTMYAYLYSSTAVFKGKLYFNGYTATVGTELFSTDGTSGGTGLVKDIYTGTSSSYPSLFSVVGGTLYFKAANAVNGSALWQTTGTGASTKLVKTSPNGDGNFNIDNLTSLGGKLYFTYNNDLWLSDGTNSGTKAIADAGLANVTAFASLLGAGNKLFIDAFDYAYGYELYEGDASAAAFAGSAIAKKINTSGLTAQIVANPFINDLKINVIAPKAQQIQLTVNNYAGQQLVAKTITVNAGTNLITLDAGKWIPGMYLINVYANEGNVSLKAIK